MALTKIGALWHGKSGSKAKYTGNIEVLGQRFKLLIFENEDKEKDSQPDFRVTTDMDTVTKAEPYTKGAKPAAEPTQVPLEAGDEPF